MEYYSLIPKKSNSLISIKEDIHFYTRISLVNNRLNYYKYFNVKFIIYVFIYIVPWYCCFICHNVYKSMA